MTTVGLPGGERVPALGIGTWRMGESRRAHAEEVATLRLAVELGCTLIDTAEMYGDGGAESLIGEAIAGMRDRVFLVTKLYPQNATREGTLAACARSLARLSTDRIDLYLLHWRGDVPLPETLEAFVHLRDEGKIRYFGVSNFDRDDMQEVWDLPGGRGVAANQVLYNLAHRGIEHDVLPWLRTHHVPLMAYSPLDQGKLLEDRQLSELARESGRTTAQLAIGWLLAQPGVIVIPKTARRERLHENLQVLERPLSPAERAELNRLFPRPARPRPMEML
jgi:diketogulonate reductase-like aldo/keto reductase